MKINLNDYVKVKLTEEGRDAYRISDRADFSRVENNTLRIQLWELAYIFGNLLWHGNPNLPFESMEVEFERDGSYPFFTVPVRDLEEIKE